MRTGGSGSKERHARQGIKDADVARDALLIGIRVGIYLELLEDKRTVTRPEEVEISGGCLEPFDVACGLSHGAGEHVGSICAHEALI